MPYPKIDSFLKLCQIIGLTGIDLFSPSDVVEKRNVRKVCLCIRTLSIKARAKDLNVPDFDVVTYTIVMPTNRVGGIRSYLEQSRSSSLSPSSYRTSREQYKKKNCIVDPNHSLDSDLESDEEDGGFNELETESNTLSPSSNAKACSLREHLSEDVYDIDSSDSHAEFELKSLDHCEHVHSNAEDWNNRPLQSTESDFISTLKSSQGASSLSLHDKEYNLAHQKTRDNLEMRQKDCVSHRIVVEGNPIGSDASLEELSQISTVDSNFDDIKHGVIKNLLKEPIIRNDKEKSQECITITDNVVVTGVCNTSTENQNATVDLVVEVKESLSTKTHTECNSNQYIECEAMSEYFTESSSSVFVADTLSEHSSSSSEENDWYTNPINSPSPCSGNFNEINNSLEESTLIPTLYLSTLSTCDTDHLVHQQILEGKVDHSDATVYNQSSNGLSNSESTIKHTDSESFFPDFISEVISSSTTRCVGQEEGIIHEKQIDVKRQTPLPSHDDVTSIIHKVTDNTQDDDNKKETKKTENETIPSSTSTSKDEESRTANIVLKSIAGSVTLIGAIVVFVHLRTGKEGTRSVITKWLFLHKLGQRLMR